MSTGPRDPRLFELFSGAIQTGLEYVRLEGTGKVHIGKHGNWPELQWHENGLPYVTNRGSDGPTNYSDAIIPGIFSFLYGLGLDSKETIPDFEKEPSFLAFLDYASTEPRLRSYMMFDRSSDFSKIRLKGMVGHALDRYIHVAKTRELDRSKLLPVYLPLERRLLDETLPVTVIVPILFLKFAVDHFRISEFGSVDKLSDDLHLAEDGKALGANPTTRSSRALLPTRCSYQTALLTITTGWL